MFTLRQRPLSLSETLICSLLSSVFTSSLSAEEDEEEKGEEEADGKGGENREQKHPLISLYLGLYSQSIFRLKVALNLPI